MVYHFKIHTEDSGFWAECLELDGCSTEGDTLEELAANAEEALKMLWRSPWSRNLHSLLCCAGCARGANGLMAML